MTQFKRYMVFEIIEYYPSGGINDCVAHSDDLDEAKRFACSLSRWDQNAELFDRVQGVELNMFEGPPNVLALKEFKRKVLALPTTIERAAMTTKDLHLEVELEKKS